MITTNKTTINGFEPVLNLKLAPGKNYLQCSDFYDIMFCVRNTDGPLMLGQAFMNVQEGRRKINGYY